MRSTSWIPSPYRKSSVLEPSTFTFLNQTRTLRNAEDWNNPQWDKLWLYNLHYFDDLNAEDALHRRTSQRILIERWIEENPAPYGNGWEPYPLSIRIVNWIKWCLIADDEPLVSSSASQVRHCLAVQIRYLFKRLEYHLLGNHLFANAKALTFAGAFFVGAEADQWLTEGLSIIDRELNEQILSDGGHFERSPMYHSIILEDLLDLVNLAGLYPHRIPATTSLAWQKIIQRMLSWLTVMMHPDGEIALFNDAAFEIASSPLELHHYAHRLRICPSTEVCSIAPKIGLLANSGYARIESSTAVLLTDVGEIGPDYLPGHAHADTLSFELSLFGQRVIVDSGTSCYGVSAERLRQRSTVAHNTIEIDGQSSSEVWGGFRVARRARPCQLKYQANQAGGVIIAGHDGYRRLTNNVIHLREWQLANDTLIICDSLTGKYSQAIGRLLFSPAVHVHAGTSRNDWILQLATGQVVNLTTSNRSVTLHESSYHPEFGISIPTKCLQYTLDAPQFTCQLKWQG